MENETPEEECWLHRHHRAGANCKEFPCWTPEKQAAKEMFERAEKEGLVTLRKGEAECVSQS
jgi:hypothetical protein